MNGTPATRVAAQPAPRSSPRSIIEDRLSRDLGVSSTSNVAEFVRGLRRRFPTEAVRLDDEVAGLPIRFDRRPRAIAGDMELEVDITTPKQRVRERLEADLRAVVEDIANRDRRSQLAAWRDSILSEFRAHGLAAAHQSEDEGQRQECVLSVRRLTEQALVARLVAVIHPRADAVFRRLAGTIDDAAQILRVVMGEVINRASLPGTTDLASMPIIDIRQRRDAAVEALTTLLSDVEDRAGRSALVYNTLLTTLDALGAQEQRVYLRVDSLRAILDGFLGELRDPRGGPTSRLSGRSAAELLRLARFLMVVAAVVASPWPAMPFGSAVPASGALENFERRLRLFAAAFVTPARGFRYAEIALPDYAVSQRPANVVQQNGRAQLRQLVAWRAEFGLEVDAFGALQVAALPPALAPIHQAQVALAVALFAADRATDLYALGAGALNAAGPEEQLAARFVYDVFRLAAFPQFLANLTLSGLLARLWQLGGVSAPSPTPAHAGAVALELTQTYRQARDAALALSPPTAQYTLPWPRP